MDRNILLFDHRDEADPGNLPIKYNIEQIKDIIAEIHKEKDIEVSIIEGNGGVDIYKKIEKAQLVIAHFKSSEIEKMLEGQEPFSIFPNRQVVVLVTTQSPGFLSNAENRHRKVQVEGRERVILFTMRTEALGFKETFKRILTLSFDDAVKIVNGKSQEIFSDSRKNPFPPLKTTEIITSIFIFCNGYLMAGTAVGKIDKKDEAEVKRLIGWEDRIKDTFPALMESGWAKAKNPKWWFSKEKIEYLKEFSKRDVVEHPYPNVDKLIDYIVKGDDIEDYKVIKEALIELGKKK
jgi:hypothetical protein